MIQALADAARNRRDLDRDGRLDHVLLDAKMGFGPAAQRAVRSLDERGRGVASVAARFERIEDLEEALPGEYFLRQPLPWEAAFLAGRCFVKYRRAGGRRRSPLPDFYIGAHAVTGGLTLLTRDARRYRSYFPALRIIAP